MKQLLPLLIQSLLFFALLAGCQSAEQRTISLRERFDAIAEDRERIGVERAVVWTTMHQQPKMKEYPGGGMIILAEEVDRIRDDGDDWVAEFLGGVIVTQVLATMIYEAQYPGMLKLIGEEMEPFLLILESKRDELRALAKEEVAIADEMISLLEASGKATPEELARLRRTLDSAR